MLTQYEKNQKKLLQLAKNSFYGAINNHFFRPLPDNEADFLVEYKDYNARRIKAKFAPLTFDQYKNKRLQYAQREGV